MVSVGRRKKVFGVKGEKRIDGFIGQVREPIFQAITGRLELLASPGVKGLQPVSSTVTGISGSLSDTVPKGNRAAKLAFLKRGNP